MYCWKKTAMKTVVLYLYPKSLAEQQRCWVPCADQSTSSLTSIMKRAALPSFHANTHLSSLLKRCGRWLTWARKREWVHRQMLSRPFLGKFILRINESLHCMARGRNCTPTSITKVSWDWEESKELLFWCLLTLRWAFPPLKFIKHF